MAEVRKRENVKEYKIDKKTEKKSSKKVKKEEDNRQKKNVKANNVEHNSLWTKFRIFCHGVKSETLKVHWPDKRTMVKYSVSTITFIIFCSLFFYLINVIFAVIQSLV